MKGWKAGERSAAEALGAWWGVSFYRSPESGGMATSRAKSLPPSVVANMVGDVICDLRDPALNPAVSFPFVVEVKTYEVIDLYALPRRGAFDISPGSKPKDSNDLWLCWYQAKVEAMRGNRWPLLLFKEDRKQWYVGFSRLAIMEGEMPLSRNDVLAFCDLGIMSWERFSVQFPRSLMEALAFRSIEAGKLKPPERWADPVDHDKPIDELLERQKIRT